jgi:L-ribulose-5-phosphate 4-epimerase
MLLKELREETIEIGLKLLEHNLVALTMGNMSARDPETGYVVIKPAGVEYPDITIEDMVVVNLKGEVVDGRLRPSTELPLHLVIYQKRSDVNAIIHTHSPYATAFAVVGQDLPALTGEASALGGTIRVAEYKRGGSWELGEAAAAALGDRDAVLLRNHGIITTGPTLKHAFYAAVIVEDGARVYIMAKIIGTPNPLPEDQVKSIRHEYLYKYFQK